MKLRSLCLAAALALAATSLGAAEQSEGVDVGGGLALTISVALGGKPLQLAGAEIGSGAALASNETGHGNPIFRVDGAESGGGRAA